MLLRQVSPLTEDAALGRLADEGEKVRRYGDFRYAAKSWNVERRVIARVEAGPQGADSRFIVTNLKCSSKSVVLTTYGSYLSDDHQPAAIGSHWSGLGG